MYSGAAPSGRCPRCGKNNLPGGRFCQYCGGALSAATPTRSAPVSPPNDRLRLVTSEPPTPSAGGIVLLVLGVVLALLGVGLLAGSVVVHEGVQSFDQVCGQNPLCHPEPDPSGPMAVGGAVLLIVGILLAVNGFARMDP